MLPDAISLPQITVPVELIWDDLLSALYELTPQIESMRPGMALLQMGSESALKPRLEQWQGQGGAADDRATAELAALTAPPGKLRRVGPGRSRTFLRQVPMATLREVGVKDAVIERLGWFGWHHISQLRSVTKSQLVAQFETGELLFRYAQANDLHPVASYVPAPCVTVRFAFEEPTREPCEVEPVLDLLVERATAKLNNRLSSSVTVALESDSHYIDQQHPDQQTLGQHPLRRQRLLKDPTSDPRLLREAALFALRGLWRAEIKVAAIEVGFGGLMAPQAAQKALFAACRPSAETALRAVEHRFPRMLRRIVMIDPHAYLPEEGFRLEPISLPTSLMSDKPRSMPQKPHLSKGRIKVRSDKGSRGNPPVQWHSRPWS